MGVTKHQLIVVCISSFAASLPINSASAIASAFYECPVGIASTVQTHASVTLQCNGLITSYLQRKHYGATGAYSETLAGQGY